MIKIAIFTEGQGELVFIRKILFLIFGYEKLSFECVKLHAENVISMPYNYPGKAPRIFFQIINVENDERVLSKIKELESQYFKKGYHKIIGLRDLYSEGYDQQAKGRINKELNDKVLAKTNEIISLMSQPEKIKIFFAIMEFEAWLLGMYNLFSKINPLLTFTYLENQLKFNLKIVDPQKKFYRPGKQLKKILNLAGLEYDKSREILEKLCSRIETDDLENIIKNGRCSAFREFFDELKTLKVENQ